MKKDISWSSVLLGVALVGSFAWYLLSEDKNITPFATVLAIVTALGVNAEFHHDSHGFALLFPAKFVGVFWSAWLIFGKSTSNGLVLFRKDEALVLGISIVAFCVSDLANLTGRGSYKE